MKKLCSLFLALLFTAVLSVCVSAEEHTHSGELEALCTGSGLQTPCCGVFRCETCGQTYEASVSPADVGLPIVCLQGSLDGISKDDKVTVSASYDDGAGIALTSFVTLKWQGASSIGYPKKNYSLQFVLKNGAKKKVEICPAWGAHSKYCLKANWVDCSAARNIVSAKLWGEIVHAACKDDALDPLVNGGAIDGFPVLLYLNGDLQGLYTFNTPKDEWIFGMNGKTDREGLLFSITATNSTHMEVPIVYDENGTVSGWKVEYCATEDSKDGIWWLFDGMNALISFISEHTGAGLRAGLGDYTDVDRAIDYMLYTFFLCSGDNLGKNTLWSTWDGVKYLPSVYDMDSTWGLYYWDATFPEDLISEWSTFDILRDDVLFCRLLDDYPNEVKARYVRLREDVLSYRNIERLFSDFIGQIPTFVYAADAELWPQSPSREQNGLKQILRFAKERLRSMDALFGVTVTEKTEFAWRAAFACENGAKVYVDPTGGSAAEPVRAASAFSADAAGKLTKTGGRIDFYVDVPQGDAAAVEVLPAEHFEMLLGPDETGTENGYRITGVSGDLTVRVRPAGEPGRETLRKIRTATPVVTAVASAAVAVPIVRVLMKKKKKKTDT